MTAQPTSRASGAPRFVTPVLRQRWGIGAPIIFALFALVVLGPLINFKATSSMGEGSPVREATYLVLFGCAIISAYLGEPRRRLLAIPASLVLMLGWCWISLIWSIAPEIALRRLILTSVFVWTICIAVQRGSSEQILNWIRFLMIVVLTLNYAAAIGWPAFGTHLVKEIGDPGLIGNWRGILVQKNFAGAFCAFTIIFFLFDASRWRGFIRWPMLAATAFFLYRTHSKTSAALLLLSLGVGYVYTTYNVRYRSAVFTILAVSILVCVIAGYAFWDELMAPFSGENALTGRVQIWPVLIAYWRDHWLGAGYGSFWNVGAGGPVFRYAKGWVTGLGNGHNGYLDLLTQVGPPGVLLALGTMVLWPLYLLLVGLAVPPQQGALLMSCLVFGAGHNVTETSLLDRDAIVEAFLVLTIALIHVVRPAPARRKSYLATSA